MVGDAQITTKRIVTKKTRIIEYWANLDKADWVNIRQYKIDIYSLLPQTL